MFSLFVSLYMVVHVWFHRTFGQHFYDDLNINETDETTYFVDSPEQLFSSKNITTILTNITVFILIFSSPFYLLSNYYLYYMMMKVASILCVLRYSNVDDEETEFIFGFSILLTYFCIVTELNFYAHNSLIYDLFNHFVLFLLC